MMLKDVQRKQVIDFMYNNMNPVLANKLYFDAIADQPIPKELENVDPYSPDLSEDQMQLIIAEAKRNPSYFFKRIVRTTNENNGAVLNTALAVYAEQGLKKSASSLMLERFKTRAEAPESFNEIIELIDAVRSRFDFKIGVTCNALIHSTLLISGYTGSIVVNNDMESQYIQLLVIDYDKPVPILAIDVGRAYTHSAKNTKH